MVDLSPLISSGAPAAHAPGQGAGVKTACCQGSHPAGQTDHIHRRAAIGSGAVAQLPPGIFAPAFDRAASGQGTGMITA
ncbi:MAG: hypothetical protein H6Q37_1695 [Chloroflexi bacterium]|nr:hypothetical protein [Chloroflexota bacterium]